MSDNINKFINNLCKDRCFFDSLKQKCISRMKKEFSFMLLYTDNLSTLIDIKLARKLQSLCKIHENRFKFIYMITAKNMIRDKCMSFYKSDTSYEFVNCLSYIRANIEKDIKAFDTRSESIVFERIRENIIEIDKGYREKKCSVDLSLFVEDILINSQDETEIVDTHKYSKRDTVSRINRLTKKIFEHYQKNSMNYYVGNAIIDNAVIQLDNEEKIEYFKSKFFAYKKEKMQKNVDMMRPFYLEEEILSRCDRDKIEASYLLYPILMELLYREKFFQYIKTPIKWRFHDVPEIKRAKKEQNEKRSIPLEPTIQDENDINEYLQDRAEETLLLLSKKESILMRLKAGYKLKKEEIFNIKLALFNGINLFENKRECFEPKEIDRELKDEIFQKVIHSEPLRAKEIGMIFNQTEKQINRKLEYIRTKIKKIGSRIK